MDFLLGAGSYSSMDVIYHYQMAKQGYEETKQMHTAGKEYRKILTNMNYLEDDFNDNAYHFGAALDRYIMVNGVIDENIAECDRRIANGIFCNPDNYSEKQPEVPTSVQSTVTPGQSESQQASNPTEESKENPEGKPGGKSEDNPEKK